MRDRGLQAHLPRAELGRVSGRDATLVVWSDYDGKGKGKGKAWFRCDDGTDAIVGGSRVER